MKKLNRIWLIPTEVSKMVFISKSSLNCFIQCPKKYYFLHIEKIPTEQTSAMERGIDVHQFCYDFYDNVKIENGNLKIDFDWISGSFLSVTEISKPYIGNFLDFEKKRWETCKDRKNPEKFFFPIFREERFENPKLEILAIVDRIDQKFNQNYTIVEYKTEKYDMKAWKLTEFRRELWFEKLVAEGTEQFKEKCPNGTIEDFVIYFPHSNDVLIEKFNYRSLSALQRNIDLMREAIRKNHFPCNVQYHCRWCPASPLCEMEMER